ncbi:MAG: D-alanyl-D-alanine carboxypeptidase family protein [Oscillospiraceae bacterium]|nr:D-alanyl-D-alanine carboxypeptidase family protein [Oscillospiraceae bacterium]
MKRLVAATVAVMLLISLVGCSNEANDEILSSGDITTEAIVAEEPVTSEEEVTAAPEETEVAEDTGSVESDEEEPAEEETTADSLGYELTEVELTMYATDPLNVREGPDADYEALGQLMVGDAVTVTGELSNGWYRIDYNGTVAYVYGEYLREEEVITEDEYTDVESDDEYYFQSEEDYLILVNKTHLLPDDYKIETDYVQGSYEMKKTAAYYCKLMIEAAAADGINLKVLSAYRTVAYQQKLFDRNVQSRMDDDGMTYEEAYADTAINIAPPGGSEHNAGLAVDIITENDWDTYTGFEDTEEFAWLQEHAAEYGFIMRYASGKEDITGFIYEPWHYRFVGVKYAADIQASGLCLEEYLEANGYIS